MKDAGQQCSGVAEADPKNETCEIGSPNIGMVNASRTYALIELLKTSEKEANER